MPPRVLPRPPIGPRLLAYGLIALLLWTVAYPNATVVVDSFGRGLTYWRTFIRSPADREALWTSLWISVISVIAACAIGIPLAFLLVRREFPGRRLLRAVAILPAALPPLVGVVAFIFLYGESGVVTRVIQRLLHRDTPPWTLSGAWAIVFVHAYTLYVYVYLLVAAGLERYDPALDEAAAGLGASPARRLARVTLPLLAPALAGAMLLVFMSSLGSFTAPYVFGGGVRVLATQIVTTRLNGALGVSYVETTVLAISAVVALILFRRLEGRWRYVLSAKAVARPARRPFRSPAMRLIGVLLAALVALVLALPHLMVILVAFARDGAWTTEVLPPAYTLDNFRHLATDADLWLPVRNSLAMTVLATAGATVVCTAAAILIVLRRVPGRRALAALTALPWAVPATAIAIGLASTFNRTSLPSARLLLVGTFWILPLAYFIRGVPLMTASVEGSLRQMDASLEDAARGLGANARLVLRRVVLPAARPGLVAGATLVAITAVGEFVASVVLYTHANRPISIAILAQMRDFAFGSAAAESTVLIAIVFLITLASRGRARG